MIGATGTYAVGTVDFSLQPSSGRWVDRESLGFDGYGHPIYPAVREFELSWQLINASDVSQIIGFYNSVASTGTVVVDVPKWGTTPYQFERYSGCTLGEPSVQQFFNEHTQEVRLLIYGIRT
jgi:hypothetical protein